MVSIITGEADREALAIAAAEEPDALWSAMSCWETVSALKRSYEMPVDKARSEAELTAQRLALRMVPIGEHELALALDAYAKYGRGHHAAGLNMGDCFAYACAKANDARLLYKGNDFAKTDLA